MELGSNEREVEARIEDLVFFDEASAWAAMVIVVGVCQPYVYLFPLSIYESGVL